uniref:Uncharacterized protein n=1 Tax=Erythrolobus australicus TaxID=1077150 RepID=A0A7S1XIE7_9RHOD
MDATVEAARAELEQEGTDAATLAALDELRTRWQQNLLAAQDFDEQQRLQDLAQRAQQEELLLQKQRLAGAAPARGSPPSRTRAPPARQAPSSPPPQSVVASQQQQQQQQQQHQPVMLPGIASFDAARRYGGHPGGALPSTMQLPHISELGSRAQPPSSAPAQLPSIGSLDPASARPQQPAPRR